MACLAVTVSTSRTVTNVTTDQSALLALKSHITSDPQNILANNWTTSTSHCNWIGVHCSTRHHRVAVLNLSYMGLRGTIPPHIGNLSFLALLDIRNNSFYGNIPKEIGHLRRLESINFFSNDFTGNLLKEIGKLASLEFIDVRWNQLSGSIPREIGNLTFLKELYLGANNLKGNIPTEISKLTNLKVLRMGWNQLSGSIPASIFNISSLERIGLDNNSLSGNLPMDMCYSLPKLYWLGLSSNQFDGQIPSCECSELQTLWLSNNKFNGEIPREIGNLTFLKELYLGTNILKDEDMVAHLSDFGISKFLGEGESIAHTKTLATLGYIAPEYGSEGLVSTRCDVYSYGIMLMEIFTRTKPTDDMFVGDLSLKVWVSESLPNAIIKVTDASLLSQEDGQLGAKVQCVSSILQLALKCCAESPQERINMKEVLETLKKIKHMFLASREGNKHEDCIALRGGSDGGSSAP